MSSIFHWFQKKWPFVSDKDFVCFATIDSFSCPVFEMEIKSELSSNYYIECYILSSYDLSSSFSKSCDVEIALFESNLERKFTGKVIAYSFEGISNNFFSDTDNFVDKYIYKIRLSAYGWPGIHEKKTIIFQSMKKIDLIKQILKEYSVDVDVSLLALSESTVYETITQYEETDFEFITRQIEELNSVFYYDVRNYSSSVNKIVIVPVEQVGKMSATSTNLSTVKEIHDNFDFDQIVQLSLKDDVLVASKSSNQKFLCECTSYNVFAGNSFIIDNSIGIQYFIEKSIFILKYKESIGWYIRNHCEGSVISTLGKYVISRKTESPKVIGVKTAYVCGDCFNAINVNSEGQLRVRILWNDLPYKYPESEESIVEQVSDTEKFATDSLDAVGGTNEQLAEIKRKQDEEALNKDKEKKVWGISNKDTAGLTGWIPLLQWNHSGDGYGNYVFPRVGYPVTVDFIGGNPDCPIIIGSSFTLNNKYPYALMEPGKEKADLFSIDGIKEKAEEVSEDTLGGPMPTNVIDAENTVMDLVEGVVVPYLDSLEKKSICSSSGNLVMKCFSYDSDNKLNNTAANEIVFFNNFEKMAIRIHSFFYIFLKAGKVVNIEAPQLMREVVGIKSVTINDKNLFLCVGESHEFYGANRVSFYSVIDPDSNGVNGSAASRLKTEVAAMIADKVSSYVGKQVTANVMLDGMEVNLFYKGDMVSVLYEGLFEYTALLGAFNVNCNMMEFLIAGAMTVQCLGIMSFMVSGSIGLTCLGLVEVAGASMVFESDTGINVIAVDLLCTLSTLVIESSSSIAVTTAGYILNVEGVIGVSAEVLGCDCTTFTLNADGPVMINAASLVISTDATFALSSTGPIVISSEAAVNIGASVITLAPA